MKLEDVFDTPIKAYDVPFSYKGFNGSLAVEIIDYMKAVYSKGALNKLKSIIDERIGELND
jgi:hypothetical protein